MNELRQIKRITEVDFPPDLHSRIMRSLYLRQFKLPLFIINGLLLLNLGLSGWHLFRSLPAELQMTPGAILARLNDLSVSAFSMLALNALLLVGGMYLVFRLNQAIFKASRTAAGEKYAKTTA